MTSAIFALIGIVIGAVLSGTVQIFIAWRARENGARAAGRILFADLITIHSAYVYATKHRDWWIEDLPLADWKIYRNVLAVSMPDDLFHAVSGAMYETERDELWRNEGVAFSERRVDPKEHFDYNRKVVEDARAILYWCGLTRRQRRSKRVKRPTNLTIKIEDG